MRLKTVIAAALMGAALLATPAASAATIVETIDFETLPTASSFIVGDIYEEDGYRLDARGASELRLFGADNARFTGSAALNNTDNGGVTRLSRVDGALFSLLSIDLAEFTSGGAATVSFTGFQDGGGTISQSFTLDGDAFGLETFDFLGFASLLAVEWTQASPFHQFDNIIVAAPVPAALPLAASGLALFGLLSLRRRR